MAYRFLCEFDFLVGAGKVLSMELKSIKDKIQHDTGEMDDDVKSQIIYASYVMLANIAKDFINEAFKLGCELNLQVYAALFLVLARRNNAQLLTMDKKLIMAANKIGVSHI